MISLRNQLRDADRAVSPVIGVILMVAITVILAAVLGTFVLELGQSAGEKAPSMSVSFEDDDQSYSDENGDRMFRISILGLSERVSVADLQLRVIEQDGTTHVFLGQDAEDSNSAGNMQLTINGNTNSSWDASTEVDVGDILIITDTGTGIDDDTDYTLQLIYIGGEDPMVVAEGEVRLR